MEEGCNMGYLTPYMFSSSQMSQPPGILSLHVMTPCTNILFRQWFESCFQNALIMMLQEPMFHLFMGLHTHSEPCNSFSPYLLPFMQTFHTAFKTLPY